jgi:hypothetical protein
MEKRDYLLDTKQSKGMWMALCWNRDSGITCLCLCRNGDILVGRNQMSIRKIFNGMVSTVVERMFGGVKVRAIVEDWKESRRTICCYCPECFTFYHHNRYHWNLFYRTKQPHCRTGMSSNLDSRYSIQFINNYFSTSFWFSKINWDNSIVVVEKRKW